MKSLVKFLMYFQIRLGLLLVISWNSKNFQQDYILMGLEKNLILINWKT